MKKITFIVCAILLLSIINIFAQEEFVGGISNSSLPIASTDGALAPKVIPAAMSIGNSKGFTYLTTYNENKFERNYELIFSGDLFSYIYKRTNGKNFNRFAVASKMYKNFSIGLNYDFYEKLKNDSEWGTSFLYRPKRFISLAGVARMFEDSYMSYQIGLSVRPFPKSNFLNDRITLSSDFLYTNDEWQKPTIGIQSEIFNGIFAGGSYNMEEENFMLNFGYAFADGITGSYNKFDNDNKFANGTIYTHRNDNLFRDLSYLEKTKSFYNFDMGNQIVEQKSYSQIGPVKFSMSNSKTLSEILEKIHQLEKDPNIDGIIIKSGNFKTSYANYIELRDAFLNYKAKGKKIVFYFENISNMNYAFAASIADKIYLNKSGGVDLQGFSLTQPYIKNLLDTLGVDVINFKSHQYKTAGNMFSETEMTDGERESLEFLLDGIYDEFKNMIDSGRSDKLANPVEMTIDNGPYFIAANAYKAGLIDQLIYESDIDNVLNKDFGKSQIIKNFNSEKISYSWEYENGKKIAVIYATGNIHSGKARIGKTIGSTTYANAIKKARKDKSVAGIILRVDSGGGSALASDIIAHEIKLCKSGKNKKPVVVSMGGVAASGGYFISAFADKIVAEPTTITGSIGVIGLIPNYERLYDKLHVNWSTIKKGKHADIGNGTRPMTDEEKEMIAQSIKNVYWDFVDTVAEGRNMNRDDVHKIAQGRVWTGKQAKENGLVDELGGLEKAYEVMKNELQVESIRPIIYPLSDKNGFTINANLSATQLNIANYLPESVKGNLDNLKFLIDNKDDKIFMILPYNFSDSK